MELRQLEFFLMVSKLNSFTRAAEQLYVSQPGVTSAIRSLEEELGIQLFDRSQKQVILTTEGRVFLNYVENVMRDISMTISGVNELKNLAKGTVRIGVPPLLAASLLPSLLFRFKSDYPSLELILVEEGSLSIQRSLEKNELDLGIVIEPQPSPALEIFPLTTQELTVCLNSGHALKHKASLALPELQEEQFILLKEDCLTRKAIMERFQHHQLTPRIFAESNHIQTIKGLVGCGAGISLLPSQTVAGDRQLLSLPLVPPLLIDIALLRPKDKYMSHAAQAFCNFIKNSYLT